MGQVRKIKAGLVKIPVGDFIGEDGNVFFDIDEGVMRLSDGNTPGGIPLNTNIPTNLIPTVSETYDLGSSAKKWRDLYLSGSTIYLGDAQITSSGTTIDLPAGTTINGNVIGFATAGGGSAVSIATIDAAGIVRIGTGLSIDESGIVSVSDDIIFSGSYNDLTDKPDLSVYATTDSVFSGSYTDLTNKPDLSVYATTDSFANADTAGIIRIGTGLSIDENGVVSVFGSVFSGSYNDLTDKPDLSAYATTDSVFSGSYTDLTNKPDLSVYATTDSVFSGSYTDLTNKPDLSVYATTDSVFSGSYNDLTNKPDLSVYATTDSLSAYATTDSVFSGSYTDLTNKPDLSVYATTDSFASTDAAGVVLIGTGLNIDESGVISVDIDGGNASSTYD